MSDGAAAVLAVLLEVTGEGRLTTPDTGLARELRLARGVLQVSVEQAGPAHARLRLEPVRSGGDTGYVGVAGESIVPRVQVAEAGLRGRLLGEVSLVAGLVDDPWVVGSQEAWGLRTVAPVMAEEQGWMARSDLGGTAAWHAPEGWLHLQVGLQTGEGLDTRERNDGQDLVAVAAVHPLAHLDPDLLELALLGREGSRGVGLARDHRVGARLSARHRLAGGGLELLAGWGLDGDATQRPAGLSAWASTGEALPVLAWARLDATRADRADADTGATTLRLGAGPALGGPANRRAGFVLAGVEHHRYAEDAASLAGAGAQANHTIFLVQLGTHLEAALPLAPLP